MTAADPPADLLVAMRLAAERDMVARQYAENFSDVFAFVVPGSPGVLAEGMTPSTAIVHTQLRLMARFVDSLIGAVRFRRGPAQRPVGRTDSRLRKPGRRRLSARTGRLRFLAALRRSPPQSGHNRRSARGRTIRLAARRPAETASLAVARCRL